MKFRLFVATCTFFSIIAFVLVKFSGPLGIEQILHELKKAAPREAFSSGLDTDEIAFSYDSIGNVSDLALEKFSSTGENAETSGPRYTLELDILQTKGEAERYLDHLQSKGIIAYYSPIHLGTKVVFRVRRGIYKNKRDAGLDGQQLSQAAGIDAKVVLLR